MVHVLKKPYNQVFNAIICFKIYSFPIYIIRELRTRGMSGVNYFMEGYVDSFFGLGFDKQNHIGKTK